MNKKRLVAKKFLLSIRRQRMSACGQQERLSFECVNPSVEILFPRHEQAGRKMRMRRGIREVLRLQAYTDIRCGSEIAGGI